MNCSRFERLIALYTEGDLPARQVKPVERHLSGCPACREFAETLKESQTRLKSLRGESLDEAVFQQVRDRVMKEIASTSLAPHRGKTTAFLATWRWKPVAVGALLVLLVASILWHSQTPNVPTPPTLVNHGRGGEGLVPTAPGQELGAAKRGQAVDRAPHKSLAQVPSRPKARRKRSVARQFESDVRASQVTQDLPFNSEAKKSESPDGKQNPLVIRLVTDDPQVLIVWLVNENRGERE